MAIGKPISGTPVDWTVPLALGVQGAWPLCDGVGLARDHARANPLLFSGNAAWAPGPDGPAVSFDGAVTTYLRPQTTLGINPATQDFTVAGWFLATSLTSSNSTIFSQEDGTGTGRSWIYVTLSGQLATNLAGTQTNSSPGVVVVNTWYHTALVCKAAASWTVYLNGAPLISLAGTQTSNGGPLRVGNWKLGTSGGGLIGLIGRSGVTLWRRALSASEVRAHRNDPYQIYEDDDEAGVISLTAPAASIFRRTLYDRAGSRGVA